MNARLPVGRQRNALLLAIALFFTAAGAAIPAVQGNSHPLGTFSANDPEGNTISLTFDSAGGLWVYANGEAYGSSTYKATGDEVEFREVNSPNETACGSVVGRYKWKLEENRLIYTLVSDSCEIRSTYLLNLRWVKSSGAPVSPARPASRDRHIFRTN